MNRKTGKDLDEALSELEKRVGLPDFVDLANEIGEALRPFSEQTDELLEGWNERLEQAKHDHQLEVDSKKRKTEEEAVRYRPDVVNQRCEELCHAIRKALCSRSIQIAEEFWESLWLEFPGTIQISECRADIDCVIEHFRNHPSCLEQELDENSFWCRFCAMDFPRQDYDETEDCCKNCADKKRRERIEYETKEREAREAARRKAQEDAKRIALEEAQRKSQEEADRKTGTIMNLILPCGKKLEMVWCSPGKFLMGSTADEKDRLSNEEPHRVRLTKGFWLSKYPVTQAQWKVFMLNNPSFFRGDNHPVEGISWEDCQKFLMKVNASLGCEMRLPTEAEWEYACRAGGRYEYGNVSGQWRYGRLEDMGWFFDNSGRQWTPASGFQGGGTHPVGQKTPNAWGFFDMHGNVWEWCSDWFGDYPKDLDYESSYSYGITYNPIGRDTGCCRVIRGGSWRDSARLCRCAYRSSEGPLSKSDNIGFRLCCSKTPSNAVLIEERT